MSPGSRVPGPERRACAGWLAALTLAAGCAGAPSSAPAARPGARAIDRVAIPPLRPFSPPKPSRHVLANGLTVFLLPNPTLPVVRLSGMLRTGSIADPAGKEGLAELCASAMRAGGSAATHGDALDERLEAIGASIDVSMGRDAASVSAFSLKEDFPEVLRLLAEVLVSPAFPQDKIQLCRMQMLGAIARENDDPEEIAGRVFPQLMYGKDHPVAREETAASVNAITREDLAAFHAAQLQPEQMVLGVSGDLESGPMLALLTETFGGWKRGGREPARVPPVGPEPARGIHLAARPEINQSTLVLGHHGIERRADDPDLPALNVMDAILGGGGFSSRLMQIVRAEEGLAYGVWSQFGTQYGYPGIFQVGCSTKSESTMQAIRSLTREVRRIRDERVTDAELATAKDSILNATAFFYASPEQILERAVRYELRGFPQDWVERYLKGVSAVTVEDVQRVAAKRLRPENLTVLVVGNPAAFDRPLSELGEVREVPLSEPAAPK